MPRHLSLCHPILAFFQVFEQCSLLHILKDQVYVFIVMEECVEFQYIGVIHKRLQLNLQNQLIFHMMILNNLLWDFL